MAIDKIQSESINLADTFAFTGTVTGAGGDNKPYFFTSKTSNQSINDDTVAKITFPASTFHSASNVFDHSNSKFTVATAGVYQLNAKATFFNADRLWGIELRIYKNGSEFSKNRFEDRQDDNQDLFRRFTLNDTTIVNASVNDYFEVYAYANTESNDAWQINGTSANHQTTFGAYKLIT